MKQKTLLLFMSVIYSVAVNAQNQTQYITYFSAGGDVCLPVKVKHSRGEFTFYENNYRIDEAINYVEAWDCQGRKILDTTPKERGSWTSNPCISKYVFTKLYPNQTSQGNNYQTDSYSQTDYTNTSVFNDLSNSVRIGSTRYDPAYPNFTVQAGLSRVHGEFIRAKACFGGQTGYVVYGGIGRDWLFDAKNEKFLGPDAKKLGWHAGLGFYGGDLNGETTTGEFALMMDYAETPMVDNGSLNLWIEGTWYFGADGHFGAFGGLGYSMGDLKADKPKFNFIFEIGLAYRFY